MIQFVVFICALFVVVLGIGIYNSRQERKYGKYMIIQKNELKNLLERSYQLGVLERYYFGIYNKDLSDLIDNARATYNVDVERLAAEKMKEYYRWV